MSGSLLGKKEGRRGFPAQENGFPSPACPRQRATVGRKCSRAAGASSAGAEQRERPEGSRRGAGRNIGKYHPPTACLVLAALGPQPGGESSRRSSQEGKEKTCCWVGACLHTEFAPGIKLISAGTSNSCPGWPKVCVSHYWDSDRGQSKCP